MTESARATAVERTSKTDRKASRTGIAAAHPHPSDITAQMLSLQRTLGNRAVSKLATSSVSAGRPATPTEAVPASKGPSARVPAAAAQLRRKQSEASGAVRQRAAGDAAVQRLSLDDVIPDAILDPIKSIVKRVTGLGPDLTAKSDAAATGAQSETDAAAGQAVNDSGAQVAGEQAKTASAAGQAGVQGAKAEASAQAAQAAGGQQAQQLDNALPIADYVSDPVKPAVQAPPAAKLPGGDGEPPAAAPAAEGGWNCDESWVLEKISTIKKAVIEGLSKAVKSIVPESILNFAERGIAKVKSAIATVKQKVEAARRAVGQWIDDKLKPVREALTKAQKWVADLVDGAKKAISAKVSQLAAWASGKWAAIKSKVTGAVNGAIDWAKKGIGGLVDRAKSLAGRFWSMLPDWLKGPLADAGKTLAAPVAAAYKAVERATAWVEKKAVELKEKLQSLADRAVKWLGEKYQKVRALVAKAGQAIGRAVSWVKQKAVEVGRAVYAKIDKLTGGRLSKWLAAAAARLEQLKGKVCALTGELAGPCVERFLPDPVGAGGKSFTSLKTKVDMIVPIEGVPVKVAAGATVTIERTAKKYNAIIAGDGFLGVGFKLSGGAGGAGGSGGTGGPGGAAATGDVTVEGTLPQKAQAILALAGQGPGFPGVKIPVGAQPPAPATGTPGAAPAGTPGPVPAGTPPTAAPGAPAAAGAGGASISGDVGKQVKVSLTYTFDATADKTTCDGLGGLTAFLASQGAAILLPPPFSELMATGGRAAFADKLTSAKMTISDKASLKAKAGSLSGAASVEEGVSIEAKTGDDKSKSLIATIFQILSGELAAEFAPGGIGLSKVGAGLSGRQELRLAYNITQDKLDASLKQALTGSATLGVFAGMAGNLPEPLKELVRKILLCLPGATEGVVSFELSSNIVNLQELAAAVDTELNKGSGASAAGVWAAVSGFLKNRDNSYLEFSAKLTLTEKILNVKATGSGDGASGSAELGINRGQEIVLCPPVRLTGGGSASGIVVPAGAFVNPGRLCEEDALIKQFGNRRRDLNIDPDKDPKAQLRPDDAPVLDSFRRIYNRLDSWNIYLRTNNPDLYPEFQSTFQIEKKREQWLADLKARTKQYKEEFRDVSNLDPDKARKQYEDYVLGNIQKEIDDSNRAIAAWYRDKTGSTESIEGIIERVHAQGTELWREAWREAILQVNRVLAELWPPAKGALVQWLAAAKARHPLLDLSGPVGELDYIGSLATGYKGPPKQLIRFNPDKYDVDANLAAPPLAKYAIGVDGVAPDRKRIFGRTTSIAPLNQFSDKAHAELSARAKGYNKEDVFDVAIDSAELPVQERNRVATERLFKLREKLPDADYQRLLDELSTGGYLTADRKGVRGDLTEAQFKAMSAIMDRYDS